MRKGVGLLLVAALLAACARDKGDPAAISRDFIVAIWTENVARVEQLACSDREWREAMRQEAVNEGDPTLQVDASALTFTVIQEQDDQIMLRAGGEVTFTTATGELIEVRNLDEQGSAFFILVDEEGWKVCDVR